MDSLWKSGRTFKWKEFWLFLVSKFKKKFKFHNNLLFIVRTTQHCGVKLSYTTINKATYFKPLGSSSGLQNMISYKVRLLLLPTGSRGLQYASFKI